MGSDKTHDKDAFDDETPQYPVEVAGFAFGQHPVTVAEYACAVRANAVREPPAHTYPQNATWPAPEWRGKTLDWAAQRRHPDHPVVCVSWEDAKAYAGWLAQASGQAWRLPAEAQWEKAACWDPAGPANQISRIYPWGDTFDISRCNTCESRIGTTTPAGAYSSGASACGAQDMAGNVWEWTSSLDTGYPYNAQDGREQTDSAGNRVRRGGSSGNASRFARAAYRGGNVPDLINVIVGVHVALAPPGS
jgi:formylglycine-generating enzyme required for sulfatase activity